MEPRPRRLPHRRLLACAAVVLLSGCGDVGVAEEGARNPALRVVDPGPSGTFPVTEREAAPDLSGTTLTGEPLSVRDLRGQVVVVNFWASWCPPCRAEAPALKAVEQQTAAAGVRFVGVNVKDDLFAARRFEQVRTVAYPSIHDQPGRLLTTFRRYAPQTPPTTLVLDREGRVAARFIGGVTESELLGPVQAVAGEPA